MANLDFENLKHLQNPRNLPLTEASIYDILLWLVPESRKSVTRLIGGGYIYEVNKKGTETNRNEVNWRSRIIILTEGTCSGTSEHELVTDNIQENYDTNTEKCVTVRLKWMASFMPNTMIWLAH